jgi:hypothetical protein
MKTGTREVSQALMDIAESLRGAENKELRKALYRLDQTLGPVQAKAADREIILRLTELREYIRLGYFNVINNYIKHLDGLIEKRETIKREAWLVKVIGALSKVFGGRNKDKGPDEFELRNKMLAEFDKIDQLAAERKRIIEEAKKLAPGYPRELGYARDIEECDRKTRSCVSAAKMIGDTLTIKTAAKDMNEHQKLMTVLTEAQTTPDALENLAAKISVYSKSLRDNTERSKDIINSVGEDYGHGGFGESGLAAINAARALDENLRDAEAPGDTSGDKADASECEMSPEINVS